MVFMYARDRRSMIAMVSKKYENGPVLSYTRKRMLPIYNLAVPRSNRMFHHLQ